MKKSMSLKSRVILTVSVIIATITLAAIISSYSIFYSSILSSTKSTQYRVTEFISDIVHEQFDSKVLAIKSFVGYVDVNQDEQKLRELLTNFCKINNMINATLSFDDGVLLKDLNGELPKGYNHKTTQWYQEGVKANGLYLTSPYEDTVTKKITVTITYPIQKKDGTKGVISGDFILDLDQYLSKFANKDLDGRIYVLHDSGYIAASVAKDRLGKNINDMFSKEIKDEISRKTAAKIFEYNEPIIYRNYKGKERLGQIVIMRDYDYSVLYGVDRQTLVKHIASMSAGISIIILCISIAGMITLYFILRRMLNPLSVYANQIYEMAENKDLTTRLQVEKDDELGAIAKAINTLNASTDDVVSEVRSAIIEVASANNELAATMEELSTTFSSQSEQVSTMVEGIEDVSNISKNTSDALSNNMDSLEQTAEATRHETEKLDKVSYEMGDIERDTVSLSETINHLSESSEQISNILGVINDIANQTNLLALNAAIEAARAGEAGRGFAVVADEVRKLAERTQHATKEIEDIINGLLRDSEEAKVAMDKSVTSVHDGTTNITGVATEIKRAVENVTLLYTAMRPVAESVSEQYVTIQSVVDNAQVIAAGLEESNAAVNEVNNTVSHIQQRTDNLKSLIEQFKI